jgi:hypothetical protein
MAVERAGDLEAGGDPSTPSEPDLPPEDDGVDRTLIRWMLTLSPGERLAVLQRHVNAVLALRGDG